jgi:hypothetical protein
MPARNGVLDNSKPGLGHYDVLYVNRNADGDLTTSGKRLLARSPEWRPVFSLPEFKVFPAYFRFIQINRQS